MAEGGTDRQAAEPAQATISLLAGSRSHCEKEAGARIACPGERRELP